MRNYALEGENYSGGNQGDFGADFGDFDNGPNEDPWYSKSPERPAAGYGQQDISQSYDGGSNSAGDMNAAYNGGGPYSGRFDSGEEDFGDEPPLLEELGINFDHIWYKTQAVINPRKQLDEHILDDADLAGPLVYCMLFGAVLLLSGKVHFGYIYGFSIFGCTSLCAVINLLDPNGKGLDIWRTSSVLGYCMLPIIGLAVVAIVLSLKGFIGLVLSIAAISWSTYTCTRIFDSALHLTQQYWLVAYPIMLFYCCFVLITVF